MLAGSLCEARLCRVFSWHMRMMTAVSLGLRDDGTSLGYSLWYVAGKGDWKHRREWLQEQRSYANAASNLLGGEICRRCSAGKTAHWAEVMFYDEWYTDEASIESGIGPIAPHALSEIGICAAQAAVFAGLVSPYGVE